MEKFWKYLSISLIGGILIETLCFILMFNSINRSIVDTGTKLTELTAVNNRGINYIESINGGLAELGAEQAGIRDSISDLQSGFGEFNKGLGAFISESGAVNATNYERYERLQAIFRELGDRSTAVEEVE